MVGKAVLKIEQFLTSCFWHVMYCTHFSYHMLQMHEHVSIKKNITPHTVRFFLVLCVLHPRTAENGVLIGKTEMSYRGMVGLG